MEDESKETPKSTEERESVRGKLQYYQELIDHMEKKRKEESELEICNP